MKWRKPHTPCKHVLSPLWCWNRLVRNQYPLWAGNPDASCISPLSCSSFSRTILISCSVLHPRPSWISLPPWPAKVTLLSAHTMDKALLVSHPSLSCIKASQSQVSAPQPAVTGVRSLSGWHTHSGSTALPQQVTKFLLIPSPQIRSATLALRAGAAKGSLTAPFVREGHWLCLCSHPLTGRPQPAVSKLLVYTQILVFKGSGWLLGWIWDAAELSTAVACLNLTSFRSNKRSSYHVPLAAFLCWQVIYMQISCLCLLLINIITKPSTEMGCGRGMQGPFDPARRVNTVLFTTN